MVRRAIFGRSLLAAFAVALAATSYCGAEEPTIDFNREIKPILASKCFACHGPDAETRKAELRLDTFEGAIAETESGGFAIVPGHPERGDLLDRVTMDDADLRMPPAETGKRVTPAEAALLKQWIAEGAEYKPHWAFVAPTYHTPPDVQHADAARNLIDRFIIARLEREGLAPSVEAERYALVRRVYLDLTGLPPTIDQAEAFASDPAPDAYEQLVDRLLAAPQYGERWAQVWLDMARYADSAGYAQDPPRTIWRYRDWVINALNKGESFDQFSIEQIAGDMLPEPNEEQLIATAFHRNTMTNSEGGTDDEEFRNAAIVDRVNTTMQVWMGMTMGCAQCHTHKYDPITQTEYFRFFAILNQTEDADRGDESPLLRTLTAEQMASRAAIEQQIASLEQAMAEKTVAQSPAPQQQRQGDLKTRFVRVELPGSGVFLHLAEVQVFVGDKNVAPLGKASQSSTDYGGDAQRAIDGNTNGEYFAENSVSHTAASDNPWWEVDLGSEQAVREIIIFNRTDGGTTERLKDARVVALSAEKEPVWVAPLGPPPSPSVKLAVPKSHAALTKIEQAALANYRSGSGNSTSPEVARLQADLEKLKKQLAGIQGVPTPVMRELPPNRHRETHLQHRGSFLDQGEVVEPGVPAAFHDLPAGAAPNRLSLAKWLVAEENPLTARVVVNRYWEQLFGMGIVETSEDFGNQGEPPTHPQLLDTLAVEFMRHGWDPKWLVREIVTSATYRQTSHVSADLAARDPYNRLLARGPRNRLSAELIRDQALAAAGLLSYKQGGPSVQPPRPRLGLASAFGGSTDWDTSPGEDKYRRGLYTSWRRTTPYPSMTTFDATSREVCTIRRIATNTPLQALVTLNDPVYVEAAQALARRMISEGGTSPAERAALGFRFCVTRPPSVAEQTRLVELYETSLARFQRDADAAKQMATEPLGPAPAEMDVPELAAWTVVANVLLNLDETLAKR